MFTIMVVNWFQILVYLSKYLQHSHIPCTTFESCELISNLGIFIKVFTTVATHAPTPATLWIDFKSWYIYQSIYNLPKLSISKYLVVNWFQILVYLSKYLQQPFLYQEQPKGCELISNLGIFIKVFTTNELS